MNDSGSFRFEVGTRFLLDDRLCEIAHELPDGKFSIADLATGGLFAATVKYLHAAYMTGELVPTSGPSHADAEPTGMADLEADQEKLEETERRFEYNRAVDAAMEDGLSKNKAVEWAIKTVAEDHGDPSPPSPRQLKKWYKRHLEHDRRAEGSIPRTTSGNTSAKLTPEQENILGEAMKEVFFQPERGTGADVFRRVEELTVAANDKRELVGLPLIPVTRPSTIYRRINLLEGSLEAVKARHGSQEARERFRNYLKKAEPKRALERVLMDHKDLDVFVVDDVIRKSQCRPWLTLMLDYKTRSILGFVLRMKDPDRTAVVACLRVAIFPKSFVSENYPEITADWLPYGIPQVIYNDGGAEFKSPEFRSILLDVGPHQVFGPPMSGWYRGAIEKIFDTIESEVIAPLQGKTFSSPEKRGDYDSEGRATVGFSFLYARLLRWTIEIYQRRTHPALGCSPNEAWVEATRDRAPFLPRNRAALSIKINRTTSYVNNKNGIRILGLTFDSVRLRRIRERHGYRRILVKYDPFDCSGIYVKDPDTGKYFWVPCIDQNYTHGLTWDQHDIIRKRTPHRDATPEELARARHSLAQELKKELARKPRGTPAAPSAIAKQLGKLADAVEPAAVFEDPNYEPAPSSTVLTSLSDDESDGASYYGRGGENDGSTNNEP